MLEPTGAPAAALVTMRPSITTSSSATQTSGDTELSFDNVAYAACVGENVEFIGTALGRYHIVQTPDGNQVEVDHFSPGTGNTASGLTSGRVWTLNHSVTSVVTRSGPGSGFIVEETDLYASANDLYPSMQVRNKIHFIVNANGVPTATQFDIVDCHTLGNG